MTADFWGPLSSDELPFVFARVPFVSEIITLASSWCRFASYQDGCHLQSKVQLALTLNNKLPLNVCQQLNAVMSSALHLSQIKRVSAFVW